MLDGPRITPLDNQIYALPALAISGAIRLGPDEYGVNAAMLSANLSGLLVSIYRNTSMEKDDFIQVYWGNPALPVATTTAPAPTEDALLYIQADRVPNGVSQVWYTVRARNNNVTESPHISVLVKRDAPGGINPDPTTPGHKLLKAPELPDDIVQNGVGPDSAPFVVTILEYPGRDVGDTVQLSWGGVFVEGQVSDLTKPLEITITQAVVNEAGDADALQVGYRCWDRVQNVSSDWSLKTAVKVWAGNADFREPAVVDAIDDVIDLAQLGQDDALVQVYLDRDYFVVGDKVTLVWAGRSSEGVAVEFQEDKPVARTNFTESFFVPNDDLRAIVMGRASVYYIRTRGNDVKNSKRVGVSVVGEVPLLLPPDIVEDPDNNGFLDPSLSRANVVVKPYTGMNEGDEVTLYWLGTLGNGTPHFFSQYRFITDNMKGKPLYFVIPAAHIGLLDGGTVEVYYQVVHASSTLPLASQRRYLQVGDATADLPAPYIDDITDDVLNPDDYPFGVYVKIAPYNNMFKDDDIYFDWVGAPSMSDHLPLPESGRGREVSFFVTPEYLQGNRDKDVEVYYRVDQPGLSRGSQRWTLHIGAASSVRLPAPNIRGVDSNAGVLDPIDVTPDAIVVVDYRQSAGGPGQVSGDRIVLEWAGEVEGGSYSETSRPLTGQAALEPVLFYVDSKYTYPNIDRTITLTYRVLHASGDESRSNAVVFNVQKPTLEKPTIQEAGGTDKLNPDDVLEGATVQIPVSTALKTGDTLKVYWEGAPGAGSVTVERPITADQGNAPYPVSIAHSVVVANDGRSINLRYDVHRANGALLDSGVSVYDIATQPGQNVLKVMGARYSESAYRASGAPRLISALHRLTLQPVRAEWKYAGGGAWTSGTTFRDTRPAEVLQVRAAGDIVNLSPANVIGNGNDTTVTGQAAFVAHRDKGDMRAWGAAAYGGTLDPNMISIDDVVEASCSRSAYAARRANNTLVLWGNAAEGATLGNIPNSNFAKVRSAGMAFAALKRTGEVVAWGNAANGGTVPPEISALRDILSLYGNGAAFAALRATRHVVAWGAAASGGTVPSSISTFNDITDVMANYAAFVALRANGHAVAWGAAAQGGTIPQEIAVRSDIAELSSATARAFAIRTNGNQVLAWGPKAYGGEVPPVIASLTDILQISSTWQAFAAVRGNGHVVAWGNAAMGAAVPEAVAGLDDIVQVAGTSRAFAALRKNGAVVAWGDQTLGGNIAPVAAELVNIVAIYANSHAFTALSSDGRVVTWGQAAGGGDSSSVPDIQHNVSYEAHGATRSLEATALRRTRL